MKIASDAELRARHETRVRTREFLLSLGLAIGQDFHTLTGAQVDALLDAAQRERYRKPRNANGSRARYYYALLLRRVKLGK